jgi:hypothetical protein
MTLKRIKRIIRRIKRRIRPAARLGVGPWVGANRAALARLLASAPEGTPLFLVNSSRFTGLALPKDSCVVCGFVQNRYRLEEGSRVELMPASDPMVGRPCSMSIEELVRALQTGEVGLTYRARALVEADCQVASAPPVVRLKPPLHYELKVAA